MAKKKQAPVAAAVHMKSGDDHLVGVSALRVLLSKDGGGWFAQGLEIDYAAAGSDLDEVKNNFSKGLVETVHQHLKMLGTIKHLLKVSPQEAWDEFYSVVPGQKDSIQSSYSVLQFHHCSETKVEEVEIEDFPFTSINFIERELLVA